MILVSSLSLCLLLVLRNLQRNCMYPIYCTCTEHYIQNFIYILSSPLWREAAFQNSLTQRAESPFEEKHDWIICRVQQICFKVQLPEGHSKSATMRCIITFAFLQRWRDCTSSLTYFSADSFFTSFWLRPTPPVFLYQPNQSRQIAARLELGSARGFGPLKGRSSSPLCTFCSLI